jgi:hypothetical protein
MAYNADKGVLINNHPNGMDVVLDPQDRIFSDTPTTEEKQNAIQHFIKTDQNYYKHLVVSVVGAWEMR